MLVPNTNTREHGRYRLAMTMKAPLRREGLLDSTLSEPVHTELAVEDTSTDGPEFAATPGVAARGPKTGAAVCV